MPFTLATGSWSDQLALPTPRGASQPPQIQAAVLSGVRSHVRSPPGPGPVRGEGAPLAVALPATTAGLLHLSVGQVLTLRDSLTGTPVRLRVTGLFRPRDPTGPYWRLSLLGTSGKFVQGTFVTYGPMLADQSILGPGGLPVSAASWLVTVDTAAIPPGQVGPLGHRLNALVDSWRGRPDLGGLQVSTGLPQVLAELASSLVVSRSLLLIGSLQLLLLATAAAALAARLLASQRDGETAMLLPGARPGGSRCWRPGRGGAAGRDRRAGRNRRGQLPHRQAHVGEPAPGRPPDRGFARREYPPGTPGGRPS